MRTNRVTFTNSDGEKLNARLDLPDHSKPAAFAIFAHCFTCNADLKPVRHIAEALTSSNLGVLRFDFTGLGHSEGNFADTNFSSNADDLVAAAAYLESEYEPPQLLVGHSLGGAAVLHVADRLASVKAIATINAPAEPAHVRKLFISAEDEVERTGQAEVQIAGRPFTIKKQFIDDLDRADLPSQVANLDRALLVLHGPKDNIVGIENAARIFESAKHPKSYVSLDDADHLLSDSVDAKYAGSVIAQWFERYQDNSTSENGTARNATSENESQVGDETAVVVRTDDGFATKVWASGHHVLVDEPLSVGGTDTGPNPYDYLLAGLGSCTSITLRMYADRKKIPLDSVTVSLRHSKIHSKDCEECETESGMIDVIERTIKLAGQLTEDQKQRLLAIADKCPVHRTLHSETVIRTELLDTSSET